MTSVLSEKFTLTCMEANSCKGCLIAGYVKENELGESDQARLLDAVTIAGTYSRQAGRIEVVDSLSQSSIPGSSEFAEIAYDGFQYWKARGCKEVLITEESEKL